MISHTFVPFCALVISAYTLLLYSNSCYPPSDRFFHLLNIHTGADGSTNFQFYVQIHIMSFTVWMTFASDSSKLAIFIMPHWVPNETYFFEMRY